MLLNSYKSTLPDGISLQVFNNDELIFQSSGKWLHPLFDFETFLQTYDGPKDNLCAHDTVIGKAAAVLMHHNGIKKAYGNLVSTLAVDYFQSEGIALEYKTLVDKIQCQTESILAPLTNPKEMYSLIQKRK